MHCTLKPLIDAWTWIWTVRVTGPRLLRWNLRHQREPRLADYLMQYVEGCLSAFCSITSLEVPVVSGRSPCSEAVASNGLSVRSKSLPIRSCWYLSTLPECNASLHAASLRLSIGAPARSTPVVNEANYDPPPESIYWRQQRRQGGFRSFLDAMQKKKPCCKTVAFSFVMAHPSIVPFWTLYVAHWCEHQAACCISVVKCSPKIVTMWIQDQKGLCARLNIATRHASSRVFQSNGDPQRACATPNKTHRNTRDGPVKGFLGVSDLSPDVLEHNLRLQLTDFEESVAACSIGNWTFHSSSEHKQHPRLQFCTAISVTAQF